MIRIDGSDSNSYIHFLSQIKMQDLKVSKSGQLQKKSIFDKIKDTFSSFPKLQANQNDVRKIVKTMIHTHIKKINASTQIAPIAKISLIQDLFQHVIPKLKDSQLIFELKNDGILSRDIENSLSAELNRLREKKGTLAGVPGTEKQMEMIKLSIRIEKAKLGKHLGVDLVKNKGATGTALVRNLKGKYIAVFKPTHEHTPLKARLLNSIKRTFGGQLSYLSHKTDAQAKAEVVAGEMDRHFGFNLSPTSQFIEFDGKQGAFQSFFKGFKEAKETDLISKEQDFDREMLIDFQKMALFDYLLGNLDRHDENWGIVSIKTREGEKQVIKIIDSANAFLCKNPQAAGKVKNQYAWKDLPIAKQLLTNEAINFVMQNLKGRKMNRFIKQIEKRYPGFFEPKMEEELYKRMNVIREMVRRRATPSQLGMIVSDSDMNQVFPPAA